MRYLPIIDLIDQNFSGEWGTEPFQEPIIKIIRNTNFTNEGKLNLNDVVERSIPKNKILLKSLKYGDIIIEKSGGSPNQPVGRVVFYDQKDGEYLFSNFTSAIRSKNEANSRYLFYLLFAHHCFKTTLSYQNKTTGILNLQLPRYLKETKIPLPPLEIQKKIAAILDKADELRQNDRKILEKYDQLAQSVFVEMFGDPVRNEKGWGKINLGEIADDIKYGTNAKSFEHRGEGAIAVIRIPNINFGYVNFNDLKYSKLPSKELEKVKLSKGDLLFVRSNGNPDYIGRCAMYDANYDAVYASYLIRIRVRKSIPIRPDFIAYHINYKTFRRRVVREARTTAGNYNLNTAGLRSFELIFPPILLQNKFADIIRKVEDQKQLSQKSLQKSEDLFQSLLQRAFRGELV
jgi:type I restriction enzyme S subunit